MLSTPHQLAHAFGIVARSGAPRGAPLALAFNGFVRQSSVVWCTGNLLPDFASKVVSGGLSLH
jgi:hypothetical protein